MPSPLAKFVWETRYRLHTPGATERSIEDSWERVAAAVASIEREPHRWAQAFIEILRDFRFLPGGRILAGAGTQRAVTLCNCFVMGHIEDSIEGIFEALKEGAVTMQQGGGVGYDFSTLRPHGCRARASGMIASGPVSFMHVWDAACATLTSTGSRRGAMMATLRCDHPDIEEFINAKRDPEVLRQFNLSVLVTDAFMDAVQADEAWPLVFPESRLEEVSGVQHQRLDKEWSGSAGLAPCRILRTMSARTLWNKLCDSANACGEPGVLFIDRINAQNNLGYRETLSATNPCGEVPLPPYGACTLGSINLTAFVRQPFTPAAALDFNAIEHTTALAVRFLDNVVDITQFPLLRQRTEAQATRRIGLGITGLADALAMLGLRYDSQAARQCCRRNHARHQGRRLWRLDRACRYQRRFFCVRPGPFSRAALHPFAAAGALQGHCSARHSQWASPGDCADRLHQPARRQYQQRYRADFPPPRHTAGAAERRHLPFLRRYRPRVCAVAREEQRRTIARVLRRGRQY